MRCSDLQTALKQWAEGRPDQEYIRPMWKTPGKIDYPTLFRLEIAALIECDQGNVSRGFFREENREGYHIGYADDDVSIEKVERFRNPRIILWPLTIRDGSKYL